LAACPRCGEELEAESRFCGNCGLPVEGPGPAPGETAARGPARKHDRTPMLILMGFIVVIAAAGIYLWQFAPTSAPRDQWDRPTETSRKPARPLTPRDYLKKGNDTKNAREKIVFYTKAIEMDPKYAPAYNNRGNVYFDKNEYELALKDYNRAIAIKPDYVIAYSNRGRLYFAKNEYEKALSDLNKVIELKPDHAYSYNNRGNIYTRQKNYDAAIIDYTKAVTLKSDFYAAYCNRGNAYFHKKNYEKALLDFNKALAIKPDYVNAYYRRAILYREIGLYDKARADYDKAASLYPRLLEAPFPLPEAKEVRP
jgi:Tfp pilus assembly protein PilF